MSRKKNSLRAVLFMAIIIALSFAAIGFGAEGKLLDFGAPWCGACLASAPAVEQLGREGIHVERINTDQRSDLAQQYRVATIPCFVWLEEGQERGRLVGTQSVEALRALARTPVAKTDVRGQPHQAWRYAHPVGYRAAVVRIDCTTRERDKLGHVIHNWGSGTLVNWSGRTILLTAKHVVQGAVGIDVYLHTGRKLTAHVLVLRDGCECCVLQLDSAVPEIQPAEVAIDISGERLESYGYGPDSKLAANAGILQGRWAGGTIEVSGYVREGDSGGAVFDGSGRLVGVIWAGGGPGEVKSGVTAVDVCIIRKMLATAFPDRSADDGWKASPTVPVQCCPGGGCGLLQNIQRPRANPNPNPAPAEPVIAEDASLLPWRNGIDKKLSDIDRKLDANGNTQPAPQQIIMPPPDVKPEPKTVREEIKEKIAADKEKVDALLESPTLQYFWTFLKIALGLFLVHAVYTVVHAHLPAIVTLLGKIPVIGGGLAGGLSAQDAFNTTIHDHLSGLVSAAKTEIAAGAQAGQADLKNAVASVQQQVTTLAGQAPSGPSQPSK